MTVGLRLRMGGGGGGGGGGGLFLISVGKFFLCNKRQNSPGRSGVS